MNTHFREQDNYVRILELTPELRKRIERTIEHLVSLLDDYDGEPDAEPLLGWTEEEAPHRKYYAPTSEGEDEDDSTGEPVNGWPNAGQPLTNAMSCDDEREQDNADWEDGGDDEAWLGWTATGNMGMYANYDLEQNGDEDEPACGWTEAIDQSCKDRIADMGPQEWSYHYGFNGSGVGKARALLRGFQHGRL